VMRDGDDGVLRSGASCPIRVGLLISYSQRSSLALGIWLMARHASAA